MSALCTVFHLKIALDWGLSHRVEYNMSNAYPPSFSVQAVNTDLFSAANWCSGEFANL
jgi:hypothetical protein